MLINLCNIARGKLGWPRKGRNTVWSYKQSATIL